MSVEDRLRTLATRYSLSDTQRDRFRHFLDLLATDPLAPTSVSDPGVAVDVHVADALTALDLPEMAQTTRIADIGSGAGIPGLPLAIALPATAVALVEASGRKCAFLQRAAAELAAENVVVVNERAETWGAGMGLHDVVTARALAPLAVLYEYAAPLLRVGGALVAWKGEVPEEELERSQRAAPLLGLEGARTVRSEPYARSVAHQLLIARKASATPARFPRRAGVARKRPLGGADR